MKPVEIDYLDGKFTVNSQMPSTLAEMLPLLGTEEAVIDEVTDNLLYRNKYPRVYRAVSAELASAHSFPRAVIDTKKAKDGTLRNIHESVNDHIRAALTGRRDDPEDKTKVTSPGLTDAQTILQALFDKLDASEPLFVKGERSGATGKVSEAALTAATAFIGEGDAKVEAVIEYIESKVPGYKIGKDSDGAATAESLARGIMALNKKIAKDAAEAAKAQLGALGALPA